MAEKLRDRQGWRQPKHIEIFEISLNKVKKRMRNQLFKATKEIFENTIIITSLKLTKIQKYQRALGRKARSRRKKQVLSQPLKSQRQHIKCISLNALGDTLSLQKVGKQRISFFKHNKKIKEKLLIMAGQYACEHLLLKQMISQVIIQQPQFMSNPTSYIQMQQQYPFQATLLKPESALQVKQVIEYDQQPRFILKEKIRMLKSLGFQNLVGLESSKSDENTITLFFEFIPAQLTTHLSSLSEDQLGKIYSGMLELGQILASKSIVHEFEVKRIGFDKRYNLKYFLGVDFKVDKNINKQQTQQNYKVQITQFLNQLPRNGPAQQSEVKAKGENIRSPKNQGQLSPKIANVMNGIESGQRKLLKKSSILESQHKDEGSNVLKASSRFTFNNDNHISIPAKQKNEQAEYKSQTRPLKIEELNTRITRLKDYMKQITKKVAPTRNTNQLRSDQQQSTQKPFEKRRSNPREKKHEAKTVKAETGEVGQRSKKNPLNLQDNRQHKQYIMLANKDKYCEQFMLFLQDNIESQRAEEQSKKGYHRENLKTQSSQMTLEIQNRVQKVIRSSLRLINGLKSRESIRCE